MFSTRAIKEESHLVTKSCDRNFPFFSASLRHVWDMQLEWHILWFLFYVYFNKTQFVKLIRAFTGSNLYWTFKTQQNSMFNLMQLDTSFIISKTVSKILPKGQSDRQTEIKRKAADAIHGRSWYQSFLLLKSFCLHSRRIGYIAGWSQLCHFDSLFRHKYGNFQNFRRSTALINLNSVRVLTKS